MREERNESPHSPSESAVGSVSQYSSTYALEETPFSTMRLGQLGSQEPYWVLFFLRLHITRVGSLARTESSTSSSSSSTHHRRLRPPPPSLGVRARVRCILSSAFLLEGGKDLGRSLQVNGQGDQTISYKEIQDGGCQNAGGLRIRRRSACSGLVRGESFVELAHHAQESRFGLQTPAVASPGRKTPQHRGRGEQGLD